jgi:hypothetical protein
MRYADAINENDVIVILGEGTVMTERIKGPHAPQRSVSKCFKGQPSVPVIQQTNREIFQCDTSSHFNLFFLLSNLVGLFANGDFLGDYFCMVEIILLDGTMQ